jgi:Phospholipid methyltransferase
MTSLRINIAVSALFTLFGGPGMVLVVGPWLITHFRLPAEEPLTRIVVAAALIAIGLIPLFDSIIRFVLQGRGTLMPAVPTEHLVVSGLYRYVRNPMYVGVLPLSPAKRCCSAIPTCSCISPVSGSDFTSSSASTRSPGSSADTPRSTHASNRTCRAGSHG